MKRSGPQAEYEGLPEQWCYSSKDLALTQGPRMGQLYFAKYVKKYVSARRQGSVLSLSFERLTSSNTEVIRPELGAIDLYPPGGDSEHVFI